MMIERWPHFGWSDRGVVVVSLQGRLIARGLIERLGWSDREMVRHIYRVVRYRGQGDLIEK